MVENAGFLPAGQRNANDATVLILPWSGGKGDQNRCAGKSNVHQGQGYGLIGRFRGFLFGSVAGDDHRSGLRLVV